HLLSCVLDCVAEVLDAPGEIPPDVPLTELGLESFTAVRLRRRLREETGLALPLPAFLDGATARTVATGSDGGTVPGVEAPAPEAAAPEGEPFPLTPVQAAYLVGRDPAFPLGGLATFWYQEFD